MHIFLALTVAILLVGYFWQFGKTFVWLCNKAESWLRDHDIEPESLEIQRWFIWLPLFVLFALISAVVSVAWPLIWYYGDMIEMGKTLWSGDPPDDWGSSSYK